MGRSPRGGEAKGDGRGGNRGIDQAQAGLRGASGWRLLATSHVLVLDRVAGGQPNSPLHRSNPCSGCFLDCRHPGFALCHHPAVHCGGDIRQITIVEAHDNQIMPVMDPLFTHIN